MPQTEEFLSPELIWLGDAKIETNAISGDQNEDDVDLPFGD
jgi:hypothetical protein